MTEAAQIQTVRAQKVRALSALWAIVRKDVLIDLRRKENLLSMFFFALLTLTTFYLAAGSLQETRFRLTPHRITLLPDARWDAAQRAALLVAVGRSFETQAAFIAALREAETRDNQGDVSIQPLTPAQRIDLVGAARGSAMQGLAPGFLWVTFLLAGVLGLDKSFGQERENGCLEGLLLTPVGRGTLYLGKLGGSAAFLAGILVLLIPLYALLFQLRLDGVWLALAAVAAGGVLGFTALGTLVGALVATLRGKEVLLPLLLFPLVAPLLIGLVQLTAAVLEGQPMAPHLHWAWLVAGFDLMYLVVGYLAFEFVVEA